MPDQVTVGFASADYLRADKSPTNQEVWGGSGWARCGQYVPHLRAAGFKVICGTAWSENGRYLSVEDADGHKELPDIIIFQRIMHDGLAQVIKSARATGQVIINDLDDWYWGLDPANEAFKASHPKHNLVENTRFYGATLAASDMLTVSTPYLAERISRRVSCPIQVIPNYVDIDRFTPVTQSPGTPTVGWAGSTSHRSGDVEMLRGVIKPFVNSGDIKLHHSGDHQPQSPSFASQIGLDPSQVSTSPRTVFADYPKMLTFDVGLVPLREAPFNEAKSFIKGIEYAASGIPFVASASSSYKALYERWSPDPGFFLAKRGDGWTKGIKALLDYETRLKYQSIVLEQVKRHHITYGVEQWVDLLRSVC